MARDLRKDLETCGKALPGPWKTLNFVDDGYDVLDTEGESVIGGGVCDSFEDARFIAESREGWPEAIKRAMDAEEEVDVLRKIIHAMCEYQSELYALIGIDKETGERLDEQRG